MEVPMGSLRCWDGRGASSCLWPIRYWSGGSLLVPPEAQGPFSSPTRSTT